MRAWIVGLGIVATCVVIGIGLGRRGGPALASPGASEGAGDERAEVAPELVRERILRGVARRSPEDGPRALPPPRVASRWDHRLRTNGVVEPARALEDEEYSRLLRKHRRIKALLVSPARDTPECAAIVALTERLGVPVAAVPDLYNALWELQTAERAARAEGGIPPEARQAMEFAAQLAWEDSQNRIARDLGISSEPLFQELLALDLHPTVFFGSPDGLAGRPGEALLVEDGR